MSKYVTINPYPAFDLVLQEQCNMLCVKTDIDIREEPAVLKGGTLQIGDVVVEMHGEKKSAGFGWFEPEDWGARFVGWIDFDINGHEVPHVLFEPVNESGRLVSQHPDYKICYLTYAYFDEGHLHFTTRACSSRILETETIKKAKS